MQIVIRKPTQEELQALRIDGWSPWRCEKSTFDWKYDEEETCYLFEGRARVKTDSGTVEIRKGDLVTFPKGLQCTWEVLEPVRKVYAFSVPKSAYA